MKCMVAKANKGTSAFRLMAKSELNDWGRPEYKRSDLGELVRRFKTNERKPEEKKGGMMAAQIPYNKLLALYFALTAAQKGTTKVVISNEHLKRYFIGSRKGERLSEKQLMRFADSLKPVFPKSIVRRDWAETNSLLE